MNHYLWEFISSSGRFIVIMATIIAAIFQLKHLSNSNRLQGLLRVFDNIESERFNTLLDDVRKEIKEKMTDPEYRHKLEIATFDRATASWRRLVNMFEMNGCLVKQGLIPGMPYLDVYALNVMQSWEAVEEVIAILRRRFGPAVYENFEYLYMRAKAFGTKYPNGTYPRNMPRAVLKDTWAEADAVIREGAD
ncbi:MAG: hypothetical protein WBR15_10965 [Gammaproteobacteria bacterium]